jgi:hypothetical protein
MRGGYVPKSLHRWEYASLNFSLIWNFHPDNKDERSFSHHSVHYHSLSHVNISTQLFTVIRRDVQITSTDSSSIQDALFFYLLKFSDGVAELLV